MHMSRLQADLRVFFLIAHVGGRVSVCQGLMNPSLLPKEPENGIKNCECM